MPPNLEINSSSFQIVIPSSFALINLLPASCPATTTEVFLDTELDVLPPNSSILIDASSLVSLSNVPVRTNVLL